MNKQVALFSEVDYEAFRKFVEGADESSDLAIDVPGNA